MMIFKSVFASNTHHESRPGVVLGPTTNRSIKPRKHAGLKPYFPSAPANPHSIPERREKERPDKRRKSDICKSPSPESKSDPLTDACVFVCVCLCT